MGDDVKFFDNFIRETEDMLKEASDKMMLLETKTSDRDAIDALFRICHTLKGNSSFFGLVNIKTLTHRMEDLLSKIRTDVGLINKNFIDLMWEGLKFIRADINAVKAEGNKVPQALTSSETEYLAKIERRLHEITKNLTAASANYRSTDTERFLIGQTDITRAVFVIRDFLEKAKSQAIEGGMIENFLGRLDELKTAFAANGDTNHAEVVDKMTSSFESMVDDSGIPNSFLIDLLEENLAILIGGIQRVDLQALSPTGEKIEIPEDTNVTFRIEEEKINEILTTIHQLDDVKKAFGHVRNQLVQTQVANDITLAFQKALNSFNFIVRDIVQMLIKIKVVSPRLLLEKIEKIIVALAKSCGKKIRFSTEGHDVFVERGKMEVLEEILPHIVRNCIDHGIEPSEERIRLGKPEEGFVSIAVSEIHDTLYVTVSDDGRGINFERVRDDAHRKGLITSEEASNLSKEDSVWLLFAAGVSTSTAVSEISGRGIGLDVVLNRIKKVGGSIHVESEPGLGSKFVISLPINKAV